MLLFTLGGFTSWCLSLEEQEQLWRFLHCKKLWNNICSKYGKAHAEWKVLCKSSSMSLSYQGITASNLAQTNGFLIQDQQKSFKGNRRILPHSLQLYWGNWWSITEKRYVTELPQSWINIRLLFLSQVEHQNLELPILHRSCHRFYLCWESQWLVSSSDDCSVYARPIYHFWSCK